MYDLIFYLAKKPCAQVDILYCIISIWLLGEGKKVTVVFIKSTVIKHSYKIYTSFSYASSTNKFLPSAAAVANSSQRLFNGLLAWPFTQTKLTVIFFASSW